jgi:undecaprenyl-diphosphatase
MSEDRAGQAPRSRSPAELRWLAWALLLVTGMLLFAGLAEEMREGASLALDQRVLRALRAPDDPGRLRGGAWLQHAAVDVTGLGSHAVVVLVLAASIGFLLLVRKPASAFLMLAAGAGGIALNSALKLLFHRVRPSVVPHLVAVGSDSFPSGHALLSAAVYLSVAVLLARVVRGRTLKLYVLAVGALLTLLIGCTRLLLGVHYPTDVLAGWLAGGLWALLCGAAAKALERRGKVERAGPELAIAAEQRKG